MEFSLQFTGWWWPPTTTLPPPCCALVCLRSARCFRLPPPAAGSLVIYSRVVSTTRRTCLPPDGRLVMPDFTALAFTGLLPPFSSRAHYPYHTTILCLLLRYRCAPAILHLLHLFSIPPRGGVSHFPRSPACGSYSYHCPGSTFLAPSAAVSATSLLSALHFVVHSFGLVGRKFSFCALRASLRF